MINFANIKESNKRKYLKVDDDYDLCRYIDRLIDELVDDDYEQALKTIQYLIEEVASVKDDCDYDNKDDGDVDIDIHDLL